MIIINNGVPKSATTLVLEYQMDLIKAKSSANGLREFKNRNEGWLWVPTVTDDLLEQMLEVDSEYGSFVFKTHGPPERNTVRLIEEFGAKLTCCFRDPRDNVLSMMDHGARTRAGGDRTGAFEQIVTVEDGVNAMKRRGKIYSGWKDNAQVLLIKYEDLMVDKLGTLKNIAQYCGIELYEMVLDSIVEKHELLKEKAWNFNKGTCYRWRSEMSAEDLALCNECIRDEITLMGYPLK